MDASGCCGNVRLREHYPKRFLKGILIVFLPLCLVLLCKAKQKTLRHPFDGLYVGNGFRFTPVFPVVKNAGVLKNDALAVRLR